MKDPALKNESWDRFLPKFKKRNVKTKKPVIKTKAPYTPFPPPQNESQVKDGPTTVHYIALQIDKELVSGEYFMKEKERLYRKEESRKVPSWLLWELLWLQQRKRSEVTKKRQLGREEGFKAPLEEPVPKKPRKDEKPSEGTRVVYTIQHLLLVVPLFAYLPSNLYLAECGGLCYLPALVVLS